MTKGKYKEGVGPLGKNGPTQVEEKGDLTVKGETAIFSCLSAIHGPPIRKKDEHWASADLKIPSS